MSDYPVHADIVPWGDWHDSVGTWTRQLGGAANGYLLSTSAAQNDYVSWKVLLQAGTWKLTVIHLRNDGHAIATWTLGTETAGTIDCYHAGIETGIITEIPAINVPADGVYELKATAATKNASASGYALGIEHLTLQQLDYSVIVTEGDSITAFGWPNTAITYAVNEYELYNVSTAGENLTQMAAEVSTEVTPYLRSGATQNIIVLFGGTNDLAQGDTAATVYTRYVNYCAARQSEGWKVIAATILPRSDSGIASGFETERQSFNSSVRANWATFADALVDLGADTTMGQPGDELNTTYYNADLVHPTTAGSTYLGNLFGPAIAALGA